MKITLKAARVNARISQETAARLLGVSKVMISRYENGHCSPSAKSFLALCDLYGVDPMDIILPDDLTYNNETKRTRN